MQENVDPKKESRSIRWRTRLTKGSAVMLRSKRDTEIWNEAVVIEVSRTHSVRWSFFFLFLKHIFFQKDTKNTY